jgi:crotonobetainyl-CoA:carnitine CoA-transferase CaiB-like acyl-CoA transferase
MFGMGMGKDAQALKPLIEPALKNRTAEELREIIEGLGGQVAIFKTYKEIFGEPQVEAVEMVEEVKHPVAGTIKEVGMPWKLSKTPVKIKSPAPTLGQHTDEILLHLGYSAEQITLLRRANIIA